MSLFGWHLSIELIFFVYGLAFFSMGLAMWLEAGRSPLLAEARALRPLALFGFIHGTHEWLEMLILSGLSRGTVYPQWLSWFRLGILAFSFVLLLVFGLQIVHVERRMTRANVFIVFTLVGLYIGATVLCLYIHRSEPQQWIGQADALARYLLAVPGALAAAVALYRRAGNMPTACQGHLPVRLRFACLRFACAGFAVYALAQVFVSPVDLFPARYLNAITFQQALGFPVQLVRAAMAVLITLSLIRLTQCLERERRNQFLAAQQARLEALEQVQRELVARENLRRELLRHIVIAQEEERMRIARELHDETSQLLTAFHLNLATLHKRLEQPTESRELIDRLRQLCQEMSQSIHRILHDLRPSQLDHLGLTSALQHLAEESMKDLGLEVTFDVHGTRRRLDPVTETVIYRVAQEALTNVSRHAQTQRAWLCLEYQAQQLILRIRDAGIGFEPSQPFNNGRGLGIAGMRERVEALGGILRLESAPGKGTLVQVTIPLGGQFEPKDNSPEQEHESTLVSFQANRAEEVWSEDHSTDVGG